MAIVYNGRYRLQGASTWSALFSARASSSYTWATAALPAGLYEVQVQAVDDSDDATSVWSATRTITVSHAPVAPASDPLVVTEAEYRVGAGSWTPLFSRLSATTYTLDTRAFADGASIGLRLRARDLSDDEVSDWSATRTITIDHPSPAPVVYAGSLAPLRGITDTERDTLLARELVVHHRLSVRAPGGTWKDVGDLAGDDYLIAAEWEDTDDAPVQSAAFTLHREVRGGDGVIRSLAPFVADSPHNAGGALIRFGAEARLETATIPRGAELTEGAWATVWSGYLDDPQWPRDTITVEGRSGARRAMDATIVDEKVYGSDAGTALADVLRQKLADNGLAGVTLAVVGDPDWYMRPAEQAPGPSVLEALTSDALAIGWLLRDRWTSRTESQLALYEPLREAIVGSLTPDITLSADDYIDVPGFRTDTDGVRNVVYVSYLNSAGDLVRYKAEDAASIAAYGPRSMQLAYDAATNINSPAAAESLGALAIHDLAEPATAAQIETRYLWAVGPGDVVLLEANDVHDSTDRQYVVTAVHHSLTREAKRSTLTLRSRAGGSPRTWLDRVVSAGGVGSNMGGSGVTTGPANLPPATTRVRIEQVSANAETVTLRVRGEVRRGADVLVSEPPVRLYAFTGVAAPVAGPAIDVEAPSGTLWTFARGAAPGTVSFETVRIGAVNDADDHTIPELGADTSGGNLRTDAVLVPSLTTLSTVVVDVTVTDDNHPGARVRITADPLGLAGPLTPATVAGPSPLTQRYTIDRPDYDQPAARPRFIGTAENEDDTPRAGMVSDSDSVDVQPVVVDIAKVTKVSIALTDATETLVEFSVTATVKRNGIPVAGYPQVRLVAATGGATLFFGPAAGTWSPSGTAWKFTRPAGSPGEVEFESELDGAIGDTDSRVVPEQGVTLGPDTTTLRTEAILVPGGTNAVQSQVDVTVTDEAHPGARVRLTAQSLGVPGAALTPAEVYGASPLTQRYTIPRPAYDAGPARPRFMGTAVNSDDSPRANVLADGDSVDVPPKAQAIAFIQTNATLTDQSETWIEYTVTATADLGTPTVKLLALAGDTARLSGPALGVASPSGTVWRFSRGPAGAGQATFRGSLAGYQDDDEPAVIPMQGATSVVPLSLAAKPLTSTAGQATFRVSPTDPSPSPTITVTVQAVGCTVTPSTPQTIASGAYVDYTVTRPSALSQTGLVMWTATAAGRLESADGVQVPAIDKTSFGPSLQVVATPGASSYSLMYTADGTVGMNIDGTGWVAAPTEGTPYVVSRNAAGGADKVLTFQAIKDGQTITQTVLVPAIGATSFTMPAGSVTVGTETKNLSADQIEIPVTVAGYAGDASFKVFYQYTSYQLVNSPLGGWYARATPHNGEAFVGGGWAYINGMVGSLIDDSSTVDSQDSWQTYMSITVIVQSKGTVVGFYQKTIPFKYSTAV